MNRSQLRIAGPTIIVSSLLFGLGVWAAWNVQRTQVMTFDVIVTDLHSMLAAQDLYIDLREVRNHLQQYLRSHDRSELAAVAALDPRVTGRLSKATSLALTAEQRDLVAVLAKNCNHVFDEFFRLRDSELPQLEFDAAVGTLIDGALGQQVITPGRQYVEVHRRVADRTNEQSRRTNDEMRQAFLLLGVCGGAAGLVAGLAIARAISRTIVELDVSIQGVAGRLRPVLDTVNVSRVGGFQEVETGLVELEQHIVEVVERLQQRESEVLRSEQLAAVGQLAAGIAHELRNPLMPMKMLVQSALERNDDRGLTGRGLQVVAQEIQRLEQTIQEFLDFARPPRLEKVTLDLRDLIRQTRSLLSSQAERQQIGLLERLPDQPVLVDADPVQIRQVVLNLLRNALEALPNGGEVEVRLQTVNEPPDRARAAASAQSEVWALLTVVDNGPGLSADIMPRLFEPFASTKETGTGLGLSICRRIVVDHGGQIVAGNRLPHGAEFMIYLPESAASAASTRTAEVTYHG